MAEDERTDHDVLARALAFVAEFHGDPHCALNGLHAEALAAEVHRLRAETASLRDALNCEPWYFGGGQAADEEVCFWCGANRYRRPTSEAAHEPECPWARFSLWPDAVKQREYFSTE